MREPHPDLEKAIKLMTEHIEARQREFGFVVSGKRHVANSVKYPKTPEVEAEIRKGVKALMEGSLLVYLFAMWEEHTPDDIDEWLTADETQKLKAYKHVRNSVAHGYKGTRAKSYKAEFEDAMPFSGITWDTEKDTVDLSEANVAMECHAFLEALTKQLVIRLHENKKP